MPFTDGYRAQVALLLRVLPFVAEEKVFALKGGTAINLFIRDMPRLSVDIDLTYLPVEDRATSLAAIDAAMVRIAERITDGVKGTRVNISRLRSDNVATKLVIRQEDVQIKVEVTPVLRGVVYEPVQRDVSSVVEDTFGFATIQVTSFPDLYAGKIMAALDRQHPRDLFDVQGLLANEGITDELRTAFLVYLASHDRPMHEVLSPARKDIEAEFERGFDGMTDEVVSIGALIEAREALIAAIVGDMPQEHRVFLLGFKRGDPDWSLLAVSGAENLPAIRWKQLNLQKLPQERRATLTEALEKVLFSDAP
jgi:predicted nucleotidyltransferase component of viral defense system